MTNLQQTADESYRKSAGASAPQARPTTLAESDAHVAAVAQTTARRAQALRSPRGTTYPTDAK